MTDTERTSRRAGRRLATAVAAQPSLPFAALVPAVAAWMAFAEGGFFVRVFAPATVVLATALAVALLALPRPRLARPSLPALAALAALVALCVWSFLSVTWALQPWIAFDGALRILPPLLALALLVLWPLSSARATVLLTIWLVGVTAAAIVELANAHAATAAFTHFHQGRLAEPVGYVNANAALWMLGALVALVAAARRDLSAPARGAAAAAAVLLLSLAVLTQSRGWLVATVAVFFAALLLRELPRLIAFALPAVAAVVVLLPSLLAVYERYRPTAPGSDLVGPIVGPLALAAAGAFAVTSVLAWVERRGAADTVAGGRRWRLLGPPLLGTAKGIAARSLLRVALVAVATAAVLAATDGRPADKARTAWREFTGAQQQAASNGARFVAGLGQQYRYDFWRVAWRRVGERPVIGYGAENFSPLYLRDGRSPETPYYAHSLPLQLLIGTGLVGLVLSAIAVGGLAVGVRRRLASGDGATRTLGVTAVLCGTYFLVHASGDWLWEFPGLSTPVLAIAALAATASPRPPRVGSLPPGPANARPANPVSLAAAVSCLLVAALLASQWAADRALRQGQRAGVDRPREARAQLELAAALNPLSPLPYEALASIQIALGEEEAARRSLEQALDRGPREPVALALSGLLEIERGRTTSGLRAVRQAARLAPRNEALREIATRAASGRAPRAAAGLDLIRRDVARRTDRR